MLDQASFFSRDGPLSNAEIIAAGVGLPRTPATVTAVARQFGIDLAGIVVRIIGAHLEDADYLRYLDHQAACACTPVELGGAEIHLGPAAFFDEATLARTLVHERTHVSQLRRFGAPDSFQRVEWEDEAYASERRITREGGPA